MQRVAGGKAELVERFADALDRGVNIERARAQGFALDQLVEQRAAQADCQHMQHGGQCVRAVLQQQCDHQRIPEYAVAQTAEQPEQVAHREVAAAPVAECAQLRVPDFNLLQ